MRWISLNDDGDCCSSFLNRYCYYYGERCLMIRCCDDGDVNRLFVHSMKEISREFLAFDVVDICNRDVPSCAALCGRNEIT